MLLDMFGKENNTLIQINVLGMNVLVAMKQQTHQGISGIMVKKQRNLQQQRKVLRLSLVLFVIIQRKKILLL